ncbi:phosphate ABC transporter permease [Pseudolysobacter antarcticus]|uniref:Transport permease protein n=1 Tax=Pseudolysobacter antarcticus TaxID=2511995 RepID=A0A411HGF5_9GAMM|nr:ABC transporter permease [Pseudolysobacter antarcticus]QBB69520.1 phosphate ABC transporter permease [Pseudolysobacter antarcticus]
MRALSLALNFTRREIRNRYLGSFSGGLWALLQPLMQLAVYSFVFVYIFKAVPIFKAGAQNAVAIGFVPFLVMGLWPWIAFSEAITRSTTVLPENAGLIGKVALPREVLVIASVGASLTLHLLGFIAICIAMALWGTPINLIMLPLALLVYLQMALLVLGLGFLFSALQVFVRDLGQVLTQLMMLWQFTSPIFYPREILPEPYRDWMGFNPFSYYPEQMRALLLGSESIAPGACFAALIVALAVLALGIVVFRRLDSHFEDFL